MMSFWDFFQVVLVLFILLSILSSHGCCTHGQWTAQDVITPCSSHSCLTDPSSFVLWKTLGSDAQFSVLLSSSPSPLPSPPLSPHFLSIKVVKTTTGLSRIGLSGISLWSFRLGLVELACPKYENTMAQVQIK